MTQPQLSPPITTTNTAWDACRFLTCSVLPVRVACNLQCPFCFSKSSISSLDELQHKRFGDTIDWHQVDLGSYYAFAAERGATRLVITGGGEPLLRPQDTLHLIREGRQYFDEIACFTNGTYLTPELAQALQQAGLSYLCYSRHAADDATTKALMGKTAPTLKAFTEAAKGLTIRATCVMAQGFVDSTERVWDYIHTLASYGIQQFTFKHTYVTYTRSVFRGSHEDQWAAAHQVEFDPFANQGTIIGSLPWGPMIRNIEGYQVCYYHEPNPNWEREHKLCRSSNLLSNGKVYASLEDQQSLLFQLNS